MNITTKGFVLVTIAAVLVGGYYGYADTLIGWTETESATESLEDVNVSGSYGYADILISWIENEPIIESLDNHSTAYLFTVTFLRKNDEINVIRVSWDEYKVLLDKIGKMWPIDIQYVGWEEFVEFEAGKPQKYKRYYDPDSERIWVENIFVGTSIRVVVYEHPPEST